MEIITKAFIPFKNQDANICKIVKGDPAYTSVLNQHIQKYKPPLCFDWEREVSHKLMYEQEEHLRQVEAGEIEKRSFGDLWDDYFPSSIDRFRDQRLIRFQPERLMYVNGTVGVECIYLGDPEDPYWIPSNVITTGHVAHIDALKGSMQERNEIMYGSCIFSFIVDPFNS